MAVWTDTSLSKLGRYATLSADYYLPEFAEAEEQLFSVKDSVTSLKQLTNAKFPITYGVLKPREVDAGNFRLARIQNSEGVFMFGDDLPPISPIQFEEYKRSEVRQGDIVLAIGGYIGPLGIVTDNCGFRININRHLARISPNAEKIDTHYLVAYLSSRISQLLLRREIRGAVQAGINITDLKLHPIFVPFKDDQSVIGDLMRTSESLLWASRLAYTKAQQLFESELGLGEMKFSKPLGYSARFSTVGLSEIFSAGRIDSQCFAPDALFFEKWLRSHVRCARLGNLIYPTVKGHQQVESAKGNCDYCSIKHVSGRELVDVSKCDIDMDTPVAGTDDLLLAITGATIGKIGIVKRYTSLAFSGDLLKIKAKSEINPNYLLLALDHRIGQVQFFRWITGSTNGHLAPRDVRRVSVPRLEESIEEQIAQLVETSFSTRLKSEQLLDQAKNRVEHLIEEAVRK